jgi:hypothetical protein
MPGEPTKLARIEKRIAKETREYAVVAGYFVFFFLSLTTYQKLVLAEYDIGYYEYGWALVQAMILGKVVLLGQFLRLGSRFENRPLVVTALWKSLVFALLTAVLISLEHLGMALLHHRSVAAVFQLSSGHGFEMLARFQIVLVAFVPFFAVRELARMSGTDDLVEVLFRARNGGARVDPG